MCYQRVVAGSRVLTQFLGFEAQPAPLPVAKLCASLAGVTGYRSHAVHPKLGKRVHSRPDEMTVRFRARGARIRALCSGRGLFDAAVQMKQRKPT